MTVTNGELRRRQRNASGMVMVVLAMMTGGMLIYVLTSFAVLPLVRGHGITTALIVVFGVGLNIIGWLKLFRSLY